MSLLFFLLGFFASIYGIIIGSGGGFIVVPILIMFFDVEPHMAAGTGLAIVFMNSISGLYVYMRQQRVLIKKGLFFGISAIPGTFIGVWLVQRVSEELFQYGLAILLVGLGLFILCKKPPSETCTTEVRMNGSSTFILMSIIGVLLGVVSSFFGIGGGWLLVPILIYLFRINPYQATATSIFALAIYSFAGVIPAIMVGNIDWDILLWTGIGACIGAQAGAVISKRLKATSITKLLALLVIIIAVMLVT